MGHFIRNALLLPGIGRGGGVAGEFKETAFRAAVLQTLVVISYFAFLISNQSDLLPLTSKRHFPPCSLDIISFLGPSSQTLETVVML